MIILKHSHCVSSLLRLYSPQCPTHLHICGWFRSVGVQQGIYIHRIPQCWCSCRLHTDPAPPRTRPHLRGGRQDAAVCNGLGHSPKNTELSQVASVKSTFSACVGTCFVNKTSTNLAPVIKTHLTSYVNRKCLSNAYFPKFNVSHFRQ